MTDASKHVFTVHDLWWSKMSLVITDSGSLIRVPSFAYCEIHADNKVTKLMIDVDRFPIESKMVMQFSKCLRFGDRASRYLDLYKIFESQKKERKVHLAAIRHALAHHSSMLTRKNIIDSLVNDFGGTEIDLSKYKYEKVFWLRYAELLILVEEELKNRLLAIKDKILMPKNYIETVSDAWAESEMPEELAKLSSDQALRKE